ncbi:hypothetical protein RND59_04555 [Vibrio ruber]|uniref:hypothetical protein n=1 Tax=Vibrio ruber TaxID=184755 RepID=UPI0028931E10|nr:hypothetical protein [Vibrio ruber]WNJ96374.1 hypothetical protein RND59_04555 [Vibrio ruber]
MIDSATGQRIVVFMDEEFGPCISMFSQNDVDTLDDLLLAEYFIPHNIFEPGILNYDGTVIAFGNAAKMDKVQEILDDISV